MTPTPERPSAEPPTPAVVVIMGVSGSGKTTVGTALAGALRWRLIEADDHHSAANVAKMTRGEPLDDADRWPWLDELRGIVDDALARGDKLVVACSALKGSYRTRLSGGDRRVRFVHLVGQPELFRARLERRRGHFMKASMLDSQLATLEAPSDAVDIDAAQSVTTIVAQIRAALGLFPDDGMAGPGSSPGDVTSREISAVSRGTNATRIPALRANRAMRAVSGVKKPPPST